MKKISTIVACFFALLLWAYNYSLAQVPGNDDICDAINLPIDGNCVSGTNIDATSDIYGGCVNSNYPSVWYTFTISVPNNAVDITFDNATFGGDGVVNTFLLIGAPDCNSPDGISTVCEHFSTTFNFNNLEEGTYFFMVATQSGDNRGDFDICATAYNGTGTMTGPEQDCIGAIYVCKTTYIQENSYIGYWENQEIPYGQTCLYTGENNSVWYIFTAQPDCGASCELTFMIETTKDYDFALYDITTIGCEGIPTADPATNPVRCNWSGILGYTGLNAPDPAPADTKLPPIIFDDQDEPTMPGISNMAAGETYVLIIDNWTGDNTGYTLNFGTSPIFDDTPPTILGAAASCTDNTILITMSEDIQCLSVIPTGFELYNNTTSTDFKGAMTEILGYNCPTYDGALTNAIQITHDGSLTSGNYTITINPPRPDDKCGNSLAAEESQVSFNYLADLTLTPSTTSICEPGDISFTAEGAPPNETDIYNLNPGNLFSNSDANGNGSFNPVTVNSTTNYIVSVDYADCIKTANQTITVEDNIITTINPMNPTICSGTTDLTASTTIDGTPCVGCTYVWSNSATTPTINVGPGTYTVTVTTAEGCAGDNNPSSTVSFASAGGGNTCDVLYVSPAGGGDGLTKGNPTDLETALTDALCSNTIIKMQTGVYNFDHFITVMDYVTIEGGYSSDFLTKTSDLTSGNATVIRRDNTTDAGDIYSCTAFKVQGGADDFRFQDLRIELPGSPNVTAHAAGSQVTNYGIHLMGTGSSGYAIVRCYIDAGIGAEP